MITKVTASGFKGWTGEQELSERTLIVGFNGTGKTARSQALQLAVNGSVIGAGKTPDAILSTFGEGDKLVAGVEINGMLFERGFVRQSSGSVSQGYKVNGAKVSKDFFLKALGDAGAPVVLNVADFMALSDNKKIEELFRLYPPAGDVAAVQGKIDAAKEKINALNAKIKSTDQAAQRIVSAKSQIQMPAGTLAEIDAEIASKEKDLAAARNNLMEIKIQEQKAEDERKAKEEADRKERERIDREAKEKARLAEEEKKKAASIPAEDPMAAKVQESLAERPGEMTKECDRLFGREGEKRPGFEFANAVGPGNGTSHNAPFLESINAIISALDDAGCGACAARMIARRELRKFQEVHQ